MERDVRIKLSAGLIAIAVGHAAILACVFTALHLPKCNDAPLLPAVQPDRYDQPIGEYRAATGPSRQLPPVNTSARGEIKQQSGTCIPCQPGYVAPNYIIPNYNGDTFKEQKQAEQVAAKYGANLATVRDFRTGGVSVYARLPDGRKWACTGTDRTSTYIGANCFTAVINDMQKGVQATVPTAPSPVPQIQPRPATPQQTSQKHQVALFLANDAQSQQLLSWFTSGRQLANLKANTYFQIYTADNPLYQQRYADQVPVDQFPAILLLQPDGGHIHAAGKSMLPRTSAELVSDLDESLSLAKSASAAPQPGGLIHQTGYSWDNAINPQMQLQSGDCPDGWCPPDSSQRPGLGGRLLDGARDQRDAMMWFGLQEIAVIALAGVAVILIIIIAVKRRYT